MNRTRAAVAAGILALLGVSTTFAQSAANYAFATGTSGTFTDMSSGTTQLVAASSDDIASGVRDIGFNFVFMGTRYTQFSASSNGYMRLGGTNVSTTQYTLGTAGAPLIACLGSDLEVSPSGVILSKVTGTFPNRVLTVEWRNMTIIYDGAGTAADGTCQAQLSESTGEIRLAYGAMNRNTSQGFNNSMDPQYVGFSTASTANNFATVDFGTNAVNTSGTLLANQATLGQPILNLNTPTDGSRRTYSLTPTVPASPTGLNFTGVGQTGMTLNWTDAPSELLYLLFRSADGGATYTFETQLAANATSHVAGGLAPGVTYSWQLYAVIEGAWSAPLAGSQATNPPGNLTSTAVGGNWSDTATWVGGAVPTAGDNVTIADGATVTIDTAATALNVTVGTGGGTATLEYQSTPARTLTVGFDVTIAANGVFQTAATGTVTTHGLSLAGSLTNNGVLDFSTNANTAGATITFTGAANATFSGSGATTDVRQITMSKGTSPASILEITTSNFSAQGSTSGAPGWLASGSGTLKLSGSFTMSSNTFTAAGYAIAATGGFWLDNPNYTVVGQNGSPTLAGLLRVSQGTFNIGTATGNSMGFNAGATVTIEGGAVNATGRFGVAVAGNAISYTQTGGIVTVCTIGNTSTTLGSFDLGTALASAISWTGGTVVTQINATTIDYRHQAGSGIPSVSGTAALQLGNASSGAAKTFNLRGVLPNTTVTSTSAGHTGQMSTTAVNYNNISRNITIDPGATFNAGNIVFLYTGATLTNNGTLTHNGASSNFVIFDDGPGIPQTYTGSGVVTAPLTALSIQNNITFTSTNQVPALAVRLFIGSITGADRITLGNGGATTGTVQIGNTTTPTNAGTFDVAPTFNLGSGGQTVSYLRTNGSRTTGPEINPTRILSSMTYDDNAPARTLTVAGGDLTLSNSATALTLTNGRVVTGSNTIILSNATGAVVRTNGFIDGYHELPYAGAANRVFHLGTETGYAPVDVNVTAGAPGSVRVGEITGTAPGLGITAAVPRHWDVNTNGLTADLTFRYLDPTDLGAVTEADLRLFAEGGSNPSGFEDAAGVLDTTANTMVKAAVVADGLFALAEAGGNLSITKDDGVTSVVPGGSLTYTIVASNTGPSAATGATVGDTIPASLTCSWTCVPAGGGSCTAGSGAAINDVVDLPPGATATYTVSCTVSGTASGTISNTATIAAPTGFSDSDLADNSATDVDNVVAPEADLSITVTNGVDGVDSPGETTYTITASNAGPDAAPVANVSDAFDPSLTCSTTCVGSGGGTCTAGTITTSINDAVSLPSGASVTYTAVCQIGPDAPTSLFNTAVVSLAGGVVDPDMSNNLDTDKDPVTSFVIFMDGFEDGTTGQWSSTTLTLGRGVLLAIEEGIGIGGRLDDALPASAFASVVIARASGSDGADLFSIEARRASAWAPVELRLTAGSGTSVSGWVAAESSFRFLELRTPVLSAGGSEGAFVTFDGRIAISLAGVSDFDESEAAELWRFASGATN